MILPFNCGGFIVSPVQVYIEQFVLRILKNLISSPILLYYSPLFKSSKIDYLYQIN
jgi:hypothetical protein